MSSHGIGCCWWRGSSWWTLEAFQPQVLELPLLRQPGLPDPFLQAEAWSREKLPPQHRGGIPTVPIGNSQRLHGGQPPPSAVRLQDSPELVPWTGHCVPGRQKAQSQSEVSAELGMVLGLHSGAKFKKKSQFNLQGYLCDPHSA